MVIGGFSDMGGDDAEKVVHEVLLSVPGYQGAPSLNPVRACRIAPVRRGHREMEKTWN